MAGTLTSIDCQVPASCVDPKELACGHIEFPYMAVAKVGMLLLIYCCVTLCSRSVVRDLQKDVCKVLSASLIASAERPVNRRFRTRGKKFTSS